MHPIGRAHTEQSFQTYWVGRTSFSVRPTGPDVRAAGSDAKRGRIHPLSTDICSDSGGVPAVNREFDHWVGPRNSVQPLTFFLQSERGLANFFHHTHFLIARRRRPLFQFRRLDIVIAPRHSDGLAQPIDLRHAGSLRRRNRSIDHDGVPIHPAPRQFIARWRTKARPD